MSAWLKGSSGVRACWYHKKTTTTKTLTGEECEGKVRKLNSVIAKNVGGATDAWECTLLWTRIFNFVEVHFPYTQRNFITKTFKSCCTKYLIASGKLLVLTVKESDGAPTRGNPQVTCSKAMRITVVQRKY